MAGDYKFFSLIWERYGDPKRFIAEVNSAMKTWGITQTALSRRAGLHQPMVSDWLTGRVIPHMQSMVLLDEALAQLIDKKKAKATDAA